VSRFLDPRVLVSTLVLAGYLAAAKGVGNLYPISTFPMFSESSGEAVTRIMARTGGEFVEVDEFTSWDCPKLPSLDTTSCAGVPSIPYVDREREDYLRAHAGSGGERVELVRRVFSFDGAQRPPYCVIAQCTAKR
jgi:hypothetical protein